MNKKIKIFSYIRLVIYTAAIIAAVMLVNGKLTTRCYWNDNFHILCPTCGMTRATINIFKFNFSEALKYHAIYTGIIFPLASILIVNDIYMIFKRCITKRIELSIIEKICGINNSKNGKYIAVILLIVIVFVMYGIIRNYIWKNANYKFAFFCLKKLKKLLILIDNTYGDII